jgi:drug/metabolite transporter (DMT)-like permease
MTSIVLALVTFFGWGSGDIFGTVSTRRIGSLPTSFLIYLVGLIVFAFYIPFAFTPLPLWAIFVSIALGSLLVFCYWSFNEALRIGNASIVGTISGSFVALVVPLSVIFLKEHINLIQLLFIASILVGIILASLNPKTLRGATLKLDKSILLSLLTMAGWGIYFTFIKIPIREVGWFWPGYIASIVGTLILAIFITIQRGRLGIKEWKNGIRPAFSAAILTTGATFSFNAALQIGSATVVAPIAGSYPILFVLLASIFFKDRISASQKVGMIFGLIGIVGLSIASV